MEMHKTDTAVVCIDPWRDQLDLKTTCRNHPEPHHAHPAVMMYF